MINAVCRGDSTFYVRASLRYLIFFPLALILLVGGAVSYGLDGGKVEQAVGINQRLGEHVDGSIELTDEYGTKFAVADRLAEGKPLVLVPVYYSCPRLCGLALAGAAQLFKELGLKAGEDYSALTVSFKHSELSAIAHSRGEEFREMAGLSPGSWMFATGGEDQIERLMGQVGFKYREEGGEYAHSSALIIITPGGQVSKYFSDIKFSPRDVKLALVEASAGKIGTLVDHLMLFCYRFDPLKGRYTLAAWNFARVGTTLFLFTCVSIVIYFVKKKA
jgi:protein SCO1/2